MDYKNFFKNHQYKIVLSIAFVLVGLLGFGLGQIYSTDSTVPEIAIEEVFSSPANYTPIVSGTQSQSTACSGGIKGSASLIYHVPGGAFYDRTTNPIRCFQTEEEAITAGFKKSSR
jgi:hypothetical protein